VKTLRLRADGGARHNPGPAALGFVIEDDQGDVLSACQQWLGTATNNQAEYRALIEGLKAMKAWDFDRLQVYMDSKLVVQQVNGNWKVKEPELKELHRQATELKKGFGDKVTLEYVPREQNRRADKLVNMAIDEKVKKPKLPG
jgi:ribonuclease HI